jgi:cell surface protein SprA
VQNQFGQKNNIDLSLALLNKLKIICIDLSTLPADGIYYQDEDISLILGNKANKLTLGKVNLILVCSYVNGRCKSRETIQDIKGEVWFNELRLADMDNQVVWQRC